MVASSKSHACRLPDGIPLAEIHAVWETAYAVKKLTFISDH